MTIALGTKVNFWPDRLPFLGTQSYPAEVVALGETVNDGKLMTTRERADKAIRLRVSNPRTGRDFFAWAAESADPAPGAFTVAKAEPAERVAPPVAPAVTARVSDSSKSDK